MTHERKAIEFIRAQPAPDVSKMTVLVPACKAPTFKRIMQPHLPPVTRERLELEIIREARQALARRFAQRSTLSTTVYVWCDLAPIAAGMGDHHPIWHEKQKRAAS